MKQIQMLKKQRTSYGGELLKTRQGRSRGRPLSTKFSMHLVLRSSQAKGHWAFNTSKNRPKVKSIIKKFSEKYHIKVHSMANVGSHLHLHIKLTTRSTYRAFIRAITSAIAMAVTGVSRWSKTVLKRPFWDYRPFSRVVQSFREYLGLKDYIEINQLEGFGLRRDQAIFLIRQQRGNSS